VKQNTKHIRVEIDTYCICSCVDMLATLWLGLTYLVYYSDYEDAIELGLYLPQALWKGVRYIQSNPLIALGLPSLSPSVAAFMLTWPRLGEVGNWPATGELVALLCSDNTLPSLVPMLFRCSQLERMYAAVGSTVFSSVGVEESCWQRSELGIWIR